MKFVPQIKFEKIFFFFEKKEPQTFYVCLLISTLPYMVLKLEVNFFHSRRVNFFSGLE